MKEDLLKQLLESILGRSKSARGEMKLCLIVHLVTIIRKKLTFNLLSQKFPMLGL